MFILCLHPEVLSDSRISKGFAAYVDCNNTLIAIKSLGGLEQIEVISVMKYWGKLAR